MARPTPSGYDVPGDARMSGQILVPMNVDVRLREVMSLAERFPSSPGVYDTPSGSPRE